ncbi:unnamed protein product [Prorocentrum cordatum]|uniref:Uncharacterized protein n=1 Tax=Prorocentrum cordatum TaxID=2364126 RepID=A0ABN9T6D8_9DINO|nr:unnamed protein product [Polarella glacialis]
MADAPPLRSARHCGPALGRCPRGAAGRAVRRGARRRRSEGGGEGEGEGARGTSAPPVGRSPQAGRQPRRQAARARCCCGRLRAAPGGGAGYLEHALRPPSKGQERACLNKTVAKAVGPRTVGVDRAGLV